MAEAATPGRRVGVRTTPAGLRAVRAGEPWLFDGSIISATPDDLPSGSIAIVFDDRRRVAGVGLWDPDSPIRVKMLHGGGAVTVDAAFWTTRLSSALERRRTLIDDPDTTAWRWVHGENDGLPGLVVDRYVDTLVVKCYTAAWVPHLDEILAALIDLGAPERIVMRRSRRIGDAFPFADGETVHGTAPTGPIVFRERGLAMAADVVSGHKTGHFLDQRDNRGLVRAAAEGCRVLDVFSATGGFALAAAAGGATSVHLVDVSQPALDTALANIAHNRHISGVAACDVATTRGDAFAVLERHVAEGREYDLVVIDPPSFAQNEASVPKALEAYERLARLGIRLTAPGGTLVHASCSSRVDVDQLAEAMGLATRGTGRRIREQRRTGHPIDHPIGFAHGGYLKALYVEVAASVAGTKN